MWLRIEADQHAERAIATRLGRFGCKVVEESPTRLRVELPSASTEGDAIVEMRLYLGTWIGSIRSFQPA